VDRCGRFTIRRHAPALAPAKDRKQIREIRPHGAPFGVKRVHGVAGEGTEMRLASSMDGSKLAFNAAVGGQKRPCDVA